MGLCAYLTKMLEESEERDKGVETLLQAVGKQTIIL